MTERDLNQIKQILGIDDLKDDIRELRKKVECIDKKVSGFWYKLVFILISVFVAYAIYGKLM